MLNLNQLQLLRDYDDNLNEFGYNDPFVELLFKQLTAMNNEQINEELCCINSAFDEAVFNNQTEGRF
jgi:hypothetical protein